MSADDLSRLSQSGDSAETFSSKAPQANQDEVFKIEAPSAHTGSWEARSIRLKHWREGTGSEGVAEEILVTIIKIAAKPTLTSTDIKTLRVAFGMLNHITATQRAEFATKFDDHVKTLRLGPDDRICQLFSSVLGDIKDKKLMGDLKSIGQEIAGIRSDEDKTKTDKIENLIKVIKKPENSQDISVPIRELVAAGYNVNVRIEGSSTLLHLACEKGNIDAVKSLLTAGANPNIRDMNGNTPLHLACNSGNKELVMALLNAKNPKANPNIRDIDGNTPLHLALSATENSALVEALLKAKADPNIRDAQGNTPLHLALSNPDNLALVEALLKAKADPNIRDARGNTPLLALSNPDNLALVEALLKAKADPNIRDADGNTPLHEACKRYDQPVITALIKAGAKPNIKNNAGEIPNIKNNTDETPTTLYQPPAGSNIIVPSSLPPTEGVQRKKLTVVVLSGTHDGSQSLGSPTSRIATAVFQKTNMQTASTSSTQQSEVEKIDDKTLKITTSERTTTLLKAAKVTKMPEKDEESQMDESQKALLDLINDKNASQESINGAIEAFISKHDINEKFLDGKNLLHLACEEGNVNVITALLEANANAHIPDGDGNTPLHLACQYDNKMAIDVLLAKIGDVDIKNKNGDTPLHLACQADNVHAINALLVKKADVNIQNEDGNTPLHLACENSNEDAIEAILQKGDAINVRIRNGLKFTPLHFACIDCSSKIINALLAKGADINAVVRKVKKERKKLPNGEYEKIKSEVIRKPIHYAVIHKNMEAIDALLSKDKDILTNNFDKEKVEEILVKLTAYRAHSNVEAGPPAADLELTQQQPSVENAAPPDLVQAPHAADKAKSKSIMKTKPSEERHVQFTKDTAPGEDEQPNTQTD